MNASVFDPSLIGFLLTKEFVQQSLAALFLLGILGGVLGPIVVSRQMAFAVHGTAELSFTGAAAALLAGFSVNVGGILGSIVAAVVFGLLGYRAKERDSVIGVVMAFGLGLGILFVSLHGQVRTAFALLAGQVVAVGSQGLITVAITTVVVLAVMAVIWRPLLFASTDPVVAESLGLPTRTLSVVFAVLLGASVAQCVQVIGALLVMSLIITPAAAAVRLTASPLHVVVLATVFAEIAALGGFILSLSPNVPSSAVITTISFLIYIVCRIVGGRRRRASGRTVAPTPITTSVSSS